MRDLTWHTADQLAAAYRSGEVSPVDAVEAALARIEHIDPQINAMVTVTAEQARDEARAAQARLGEDDDLPPLFGVPVSVKDLIDTAGVRTTYGARSFADHVPESDSISWARLKRAGAILIGKTTTPEFGLLGVTESHLTGSTSTPWDRNCNAGGSSGGAAASVVAGMTAVALGSDGGGSIRVPASLCGAVGIKPSQGRIAHLDNTEPGSTDGPLARTVLDAATMLDALAGWDRSDRFSLRSTGERYAEAARSSGDMRGLRVAASTGDEQGDVDDDVRDAFLASLEVMRELGAEVQEVTLDLPDPEQYFAAYWGPEYIEYAEMLEEAGEPLWPLIASMADRARALSSVDVSQAFRSTRTEIYLEYMRVLEDVDLLVTPTTPYAALPHDGDMSHEVERDGQRARHRGLDLHRLTEAPTHAGLPAISLPNGVTRDGLPTGLQIIGSVQDDIGIIAAAARFEQATDWHLRRPAFDIALSGS